ncbi:membrane fusion protein, multidrug efflux system [Cohaesibacter marisflavi]|uniref:Membrane fusion protein, multidrug efflux system n=2 Tax=Cohaesibacter marisflavi TaxID=655353 RepID=A0A1I5L6Y2_9HYPH|nr:membrane fusion protein, multidrug efflux system [Cohaesibacter marisflavi]
MTGLSQRRLTMPTVPIRYRTPDVSSPAAAFKRGILSVLGAFSLLHMLVIPAQAQGRPPMPVGIVVVQPDQVAISSELPGRVSATRIAEVRARAGGIVEERIFEQGSLVEAGDLLFRLDAAPYEIAVEAAKASVARAEAVLADTRQTEKRLVQLKERNVASTADLETAQTNRLQAEASLAEAQAQLRAAEVNLSYTEIRAPIAGRTGRTQVTEGALVAAQGAVLTTIQQLDVVYADMQQPVSELLRLRRALADGALNEVAPATAEVDLYLDDGSLYPHSGQLLFAESTVQRSSGQVTLRAQFPNPEGTLLPGMYVRVSVEQATQDDALLLPQQAVRRTASGDAQVLVVNDSGIVETRPVKPGRTTGNSILIDSGLQGGEMVIVDGFQKIGPGAPVAPVCWTDPAKQDATPPEACTQRVDALPNNG